MDGRLNLQQALIKYPTSLGYYLKYTNDSALEEDFVSGKEVDDLIQFPSRSEEKLRLRLNDLSEDIKSADLAARPFLQVRIDETNLLLAQVVMNARKQVIPDFELSNSRLFLSPSTERFDYLLQRVQKKREYESITENDVFNNNMEKVRQLTAGLIGEISEALRKELDPLRAARRVVERKGWDKEGWEVERDRKRNGSLVAPRYKKLILGNAIERVPRISQIGIMAHECMHIWRATGGVDSDPTNHLLSASEEGIAHLIELIAKGKHFYPARYWRYLAIGLAIGLDGGSKRSAKEVYDILKPLYSSRMPGSDKQAQHYIFGTVMRVWQGSPLSVKGAVLYRDVKYSEGSFMVKDFLSRQVLTTSEISYILSHKVVVK